MNFVLALNFKAIALTLAILAAPFILLALEGVKGKKNFLKSLSLKPFPSVKGTLSEAVKLFALVFLVLLVEGIALRELGLLDNGIVADVILAQNAFTLLLAVTIGPLGEELLFRGYLQKKIGIILQSALFALFHLGYGSVSEIAAAFSVAVLFGLSFKQKRNIYALVLAHALYNLLSISIVLSL
jgi:hypothetical protein